MNYSKNEYKGYDQNWNIAQHPHNKFIYVANSKGLLEFDGSQWHEYDLPNKQKIRSVAMSPDGKIFTGALGEFGYWEIKEGKKPSYVSLKGLVPDEKFPGEEIWNIVPFADGAYFQSFAFIYLYKNNKVVKLNAPGTLLFAKNVNGKMFVPVLEKGIYALHDTSFVFLKGTEILSAEPVNILLGYKQNGLLVGTEKGLYEYNEEKLVPFNAATNVFFARNHLNRGLEISKNRFAFGTILNGIVITDSLGNIVQHINQKTGLQNNTVLSFAIDANGDLWAGLDKGIDLLKISSPILYFKDYHGSIGTVYDAAYFEGKLYLGTNHGLFFTDVGSKSNDFSLVPETQGQVWDLQVADNQLLCGHNKGTFLIAQGKATLISTYTGGWVVKPHRLQPGYLIEGNYTSIAFFKKNQQGRWAFSHILENFPNPVNQLEIDNEGNVWANILGRKLLKIELSPDLRKAEKVGPVVASANGLYDLNLFSLGKQTAFSHANQVFVFNDATRQAEPSALLKDYPPMVYKIFSFDGLGDFIINKDGSLNILLKEMNNKNIFIGKFQWVDEYENIVQIDKHNFLICTDNGFAILPEKSLLDFLKISTAPPVLRSVEVPDATDKNRYFQTGGHISDISLKHFENTVKVSFSTPGYFGNVQYKYWLENSTKNWSDFESISQKEFVNLQPGHYIFHLRSNISDKETSFHLYVQSPWYWNPWSQVFYVALLMGLVFMLYYRHLQKTKFQQAKALKKMERKLQRQEEESNKEILRLKSEQLEQDLIRKSEEIANTTMVLIKKTEILMEIKEELLQMKSEPNQQNHNKIYHNVLHLIDANITNEKDWQVFEDNFNRVHDEFFMKLVKEFPGLTPSDLKLAALLRMNHSTKEIAQLLNITYRSVELKRYRLRKKMNLNMDVNLNDFMIKY